MISFWFCISLWFCSPSLSQQTQRKCRNVESLGARILSSTSLSVAVICNRWRENLLPTFPSPCNNMGHVMSMVYTCVCPLQWSRRHCLFVHHHLTCFIRKLMLPISPCDVVGDLVGPWIALVPVIRPPPIFTSHSSHNLVSKPFLSSNLASFIPVQSLQPHQSNTCGAPFHSTWVV